MKILNFIQSFYPPSRGARGVCLLLLLILTIACSAQDVRRPWKFRKKVDFNDTIQFNGPVMHGTKVISEIADITDLPAPGEGDTDSTWVDTTFIKDPKPSIPSLLVWSEDSTKWLAETLVDVTGDSLVLISEIDSALVGDTLYIKAIFINGTFHIETATSGAVFYDNSGTVSSSANLTYLFNTLKLITATADTGIYIVNSSSGSALLVRSTSNGAGISIQNPGTGNPLSITKSTSTPVYFITPDGYIKSALITAALTDGAPTYAELDAAIGITPAAATSGFKVTIKDSTGTGLLYKVESDGTNWYYTTMTLAL